MTEAPLIAKALRLVSLALLISSVALLASAGYSGYQEYTALSGTFSQLSTSSSPANSSRLSESFNGTDLVISGLEVPNNMSYPLDVRVSGYVKLEGSTIGNFTTPMELIQPGETRPISLDARLDFQKALSNESSLGAILLNPSLLTFETTIYANVVPLLNLNFTSTSNSTIPAVLSNFNLNPQSPSCSTAGCLLPIDFSWSNPSPIGFEGNLTVAVTQLAGAANSSSLPKISLPLSVVSGSPGNKTVNLFIPSRDLSSQSFAPGSHIGLNVTFSAFGTNATIPESLVVS